MFQQLYLPCAKIQESPLLSCCTYCIKSSHLNNHQIRWPYARGCFPKIKGKAWFRQHLPEDGKTAVELGGCNLHVLGRFDAVMSTVLGPHTHVYMQCIMYRYAPSRPSLWLKARTLSYRSVSEEKLKRER